MSEAVGVNTQLNQAPNVGTPTVSRVANSTSELTITATATDEDEGDNLTYKLLRGTSANDANPTELTLTPEKIEGRTVTFKDTGLSMDTYYWYKIKVSDGINNATSTNYSSERTYCLGQYCEGGGYNYQDCPNCENGQVSCTNSLCSSGKVECTTCGGKGYTSYVKGDKCTSCNGSGSFPVSCSNYTEGSAGLSFVGNQMCVRCRATGLDRICVYCYDCARGSAVGSKIYCSTCGSVNYSSYLSSHPVCSSCNGSGYRLSMNCRKCSGGLLTCATCGGDRQNALWQLRRKGIHFEIIQL